MTSLYSEHLRKVQNTYAEAAARAGVDGIALHAGTLRYRFEDDREVPFVANPHVRYWLPIEVPPETWVLIQPGEKPTLVYTQPEDYWHLPPADPSGDWLDGFELKVARSQAAARASLPAQRKRWLFIGEDIALGEELGFGRVNAREAIDYVDYHRAFKTPYEIDCLARANQRAAAAHRAARQAFEEGASEYAIHLAYLHAAAHTDNELPYSSIVALNEHAAVLHYQHLDRTAPPAHRSFLIDAGAQHQGYISDITRTYSADGGAFADLIEAMDALQLEVVAGACAGEGYPDLHQRTHELLAGVLLEHGLATGSGQALVETGVTRVFYPHGLGHYIGLQVHDVGGFSGDDRGTRIPRPDDHPFLRLTRKLEPTQTLTIEPGLYFIDMLLEQAQSDPAQGELIEWDTVDALRPYGGIRIEDNIVIEESGAPRNLTREAFAALASS